MTEPGERMTDVRMTRLILTSAAVLAIWRFCSRASMVIFCTEALSLAASALVVAVAVRLLTSWRSSRT